MTTDSEHRGVAIIGMACRFPGANNPGEFWENLCNGVDSIRHFADDELLQSGVSKRQLGRADYVKASPVIDDHDKFDAGFFEYSPREARMMDPQQRILLETAWHALEDAGKVPGSMNGRVGAFTGSGGVVTSYLLAQAALQAGTTGGVEHLANDKDFLSTKLSYKLGLTGPSINVQTACSTSMVAVHLACQSILDGECEMALAGGSVVRVPHIQGYTYRPGDILSPDGKCRAYDADAEGTVFGSGAGLVVLKHVEDALADGDRIYAVILGSAINNDGNDKLSYTASSTQGQEQAMAAAFAAADVPPSTIGYVEGHGTGTVVGDPLEVEALRRCFASDPKTETSGCFLGSVKTNIGHLEQAAGIASLIKTVLALYHGQVPPSLNFSKPNPRIDFEGGPFVIPTKTVDWQKAGSPRRAAINSLGLGGTNAFAVLQQAPSIDIRTATTPPINLLAVSANTQAALAASVDQWCEHLAASTSANVADPCFSAATCRLHMKHRIAVGGTGAAELAAALAQRRENPVQISGDRKLAFLFPGQGAQYPSMARQLYEGETNFRTAFDTVASRLLSKFEIDIASAIFTDRDAVALANTEILQPAMFAVEWALVAMLRAWGIQPDAVLGHSVGAYAAAATAGIFSVENATDLIAHRARLMGQLPAGGAMCAIFDDADSARALCDQVNGLCIAAINSPMSTVLAGPESAVDRLMELAKGKDIAVRRLQVSHAFHSSLMDDAVGPFHEIVTSHAAQAGNVAFVSDRTGAVIEGVPEAGDFSRHIVEPVQFASGLATLHELGCTDYIEVGPGTALRSFLAAVPHSSGVHAMGMLNAKESDWSNTASTLGRLWERGYDVDLGSFYSAYGACRTDIPLYSFDRQRYWLDDAGSGSFQASTGLCGPEIRIPGEVRCFQSRLSASPLSWLPDHRVYHEVTLPVAAALIGFCEAGELATGKPVEVRNLAYQEACLVAADDERLLHFELPKETFGGRARLLSVAGTERSGEDWRVHCEASLHPYRPEPREVVNIDELLDRHDQKLDSGVYYSALDKLGLNYGPGFRNVRQLYLGKTSALARIALLEDAVEVDAPMHPALLDACLHLFPAATGEYGDFSDTGDDDVTYLPITIEGFAIHKDVPGEVWSLCRLRQEDDQPADRRVVDIEIYANDGAHIASLTGLTIKKLTRGEFLPSGQAAIKDWLYGVDWMPHPTPPETPASNNGEWLLVVDTATDADFLLSAFAEAGERYRLLSVNDLLAGHFDQLEFPEDAVEPVAGIIVATGLSMAPLDSMDAKELENESHRQFETSRAVLLVATETLSSLQVQPKIWYLTRGAQAPLDEHLGGEALQSVLWGHGRAIAQEHPNVWGGLIDIDHRTTGEDVLSALSLPDGEDQIALRDGGRFVPRLVQRKLDRPSASDTVPIDPEASYLITGGLGALGLKIAEWLVDEQGARNLWLVSRRAPSAEHQSYIRQLEELGATVHVASCDIASEDQVQNLIRTIASKGKPLDGIIHCAGLLDDGIMIEMDWEQYHRVTRAKIEGSWVLHRAVEHIDLGHFVLFSSILSVIGSMGQLNYVSGNSFQDGLVSYRRRLGLAATAMNWGPWENAGLAVDAGERGRAIWRARGTRFIPEDIGLQVMSATLARGFEHMVVTHTDWSRFVTQFAKPPKLYQQLSQGGGGGGRRILNDLAAVREQIGVADAEHRSALLRSAIEQICMVNLELDDAPDGNVSLRELGLDSLMSITVINDIENVFGTRLPAKELLRGPSIEELTQMVRRSLPEMFSDVSTGQGAAPPESGDEQLQSERPDPIFTVRQGKPGSWLVIQKPRPNARIRMFCFPFAGGGSAVFDRWGEAFDPSIEIVSVEAPGRLGRIDEEPVRTVEQFARGLCPELIEKLDRPYAVLGHCLGGLTLYETLRFLQARRQPMPVHIFVSGARPPSVLRAPGNFEAELDQRLQSYSEYRAGKLGHEQPDEVFAEIVRAFGISESSRMLEVEELRQLVLPTVRAEFEMTSRYVYLPERPFAVPITCFRGRKDDYVHRVDASIWSKFTSRNFELFERDTGHFAIVEDFDFIRSVIEDRLLLQHSEIA